MNLPSSWDVCGEPWLPLKPQTQWWALGPPRLVAPNWDLEQGALALTQKWAGCVHGSTYAETKDGVRSPKWGATGGMWNMSSSCSLGYRSCVISAASLASENLGILARFSSRAIGKWTSRCEIFLLNLLPPLLKCEINDQIRLLTLQGL